VAANSTYLYHQDEESLAACKKTMSQEFKTSDLFYIQFFTSGSDK
jgi:hypothetical protein